MKPLIFGFLAVVLAGCAALEPEPSSGPGTPVRGPVIHPKQVAVPLATATPISLRTQAVQHTIQPQRVGDLPATLQEPPRTVSMLLGSSWFGGHLKAESELAQSAVGGHVTAPAEPSRSGLFRVSLTGTDGRLRYGASMRSSGEAFYGQADQASREVWAEWGMEWLALRSSLSERWDNVNHDPLRARFRTLEQRTAVTLGRPTETSMMVSYARGLTGSSLEPVGTPSVRTVNDIVEASLGYTRSNWNARIFSSYALVSDRLGSSDSQGVTHGLQASYRPNGRVTIAPALSFREDQQRWSGTQIETPAASLSLSYVPQPAFNVTAFGLYSRAHSSDRLIDSNTYKLKSVLTWTALRTQGWTTALSFDAGYTASVDNSPTGRSTGDLSGLVRVQLFDY